MTFASHRAIEPYAYAVEDKVAEINMRVDDSDVAVWLWYGDRYVKQYDDKVPMAAYSLVHSGAIFSIRLAVPSRRLRYVFEIRKKSGETVWLGSMGLKNAREEAVAFELPYLTPRDIYQVPDWTKNAVAYQIFVDRFDRGRNRAHKHIDWQGTPTTQNMYGGDLAGITRRLDYLQDLGANVLYLTPIFLSPSNHKYDTTDYYVIDPNFGTKADLRTLVESAHARGMRIMLDAVFNHIGHTSRFFQDVIRNGRQSRYWDWFFVQGQHVADDLSNYETFANHVPSMPKLNVAHPEVEAYLIQVARHWIQECDIDGWRLDVANEVDHVFWRKLRNAVKALKSDALIIGEVWGDALPWLHGDQFDGVMNYWLFEILNALPGLVKSDPGELVAQLNAWQFFYPQQAIQSSFNLIGSHDTSRIYSRLGKDLSLFIHVMALLFMLPGIPMLYYGDEIAMEGGQDPDCRRPMIWNKKYQNGRVFDLVRHLAYLKRHEPALSAPRVSIRLRDGKYVQLERHAENGDVVVLFINYDATTYRIPDEVAVLYSGNDHNVPPQGIAIWKYFEEGNR